MKFSNLWHLCGKLYLYSIKNENDMRELKKCLKNINDFYTYINKYKTY